MIDSVVVMDFYDDTKHYCVAHESKPPWPIQNLVQEHMGGGENAKQVKCWQTYNPYAKEANVKHKTKK